MSCAAGDMSSPMMKYNFVEPQKEIRNAMDMTRWENSETFYDLLGFINSICMCIQGKSLSLKCDVSPVVQKLINMLENFEKLAIETPPIDQPQRFGNVAFRTWYQKLKDQVTPALKDVLPDHLQCAIIEIVPYILDSFGNPTRIDYGTGHELSFILFLMTFFKIGALSKSDELAVVLKVFNTYLNFVRKLQVTYRMEPAGSHGVWSLDDYQFIPFIWGSAQLIGTSIEPVKFVEPETIEEYRKEFMFIGCIDYILQVKTGHIAEHSNKLWSISAVPSWSKICTGLIKMYQKEMLSKFPVIQHVLFGSIFKLNPVKPGTRLPQARLGMGPVPKEAHHMLPPRLPPQ
ncbi:CLUMA_CG014249, isoform A [Clunio marinus]|uniref:Serine/threonine-protein phosphatase 2A activator n=1 Tax=Clunio marinus TaxID=568069 RepID=A0A1J1INJ8_9DIPT|nr:CLUMA_CG014249, isoform A [Clunio marinus]